MQNNYFDIAIIGGGLAGLSLAIQSASHGYRTVLFEKEQYPFHKVCGEYISLESRPFLEQLGVPFAQMQLPIINKLQTSDAAGRLYNFSLPLGGFGISRYTLDNILYNLALAKGVSVITATKVTNTSYVNNEFKIETSGGIFTAAVAAACYGKRSNIDIKLKRNFITRKANSLNNYIGVKYHVRLPHDATTISLHNFHNGYCGISKIEDDKSCLCYLTTEGNLNANGKSIAEMEKNVLMKNPRLKEIFLNAEFLYEKPVTISKVSFNKKKQVEDHLIMTGDAAGMITPLCGNGMSMALHASKLAFQSIDLFLKKKLDREHMEKMYINSWKKEFSTRLLAGRTVQRIFGGETSTELFLKTINQLPLLSNAIIRSTHGRPF